jgi:type IV secretion system protein TrbF
MSFKRSSSQRTARNAPVHARDAAHLEDGHEAPAAAQDPGLSAGLSTYFEVFHLPRWLMARSGYMIGFLVAVILGQQIDIYNISKNSGPRPYFLEHDDKSGAVWVSNRVAEEYNATADNDTYFLRKWAVRFQSIDQNANYTLNTAQPAAYGWTTGNATSEFNEYFDKTDKVAELVAKYPGLSREVKEVGTSYSADGKTAFMIVQRVWKINGVETAVDSHAAHDSVLLRIDFQSLPEALNKLSAEDAKKERDDNPLVLRISHFTVAPYYGPGGAS